MYRFAYRLCGEAEVAKDLVQETFLNAYRAYDRFRGDAQVSTWLYAIASHACQRMRRKRKGEPERELSLEEFVPTSEGEFALRDGAKQFFICLGGGCRGDEVARSRGKKRGSDAVALAGWSVAFHAMLTIDRLSAIEPIGGLGEHESSAAAGQQENEQQHVGKRNPSLCRRGQESSRRWFPFMASRRPRFRRRPHRMCHDRSRRRRSPQYLAAESCTIFF